MAVWQQTSPCRGVLPVSFWGMDATKEGPASLVNNNKCINHFKPMIKQKIRQDLLTLSSISCLR